MYIYKFHIAENLVRGFRNAIAFSETLNGVEAGGRISIGFCVDIMLLRKRENNFPGKGRKQIHFSFLDRDEYVNTHVKVLNFI